MVNFEELKYNLYELLNIPKNSNIKQIKKAYRALIIQFHPDKASKLEEEIFHNITIAYSVLSDENERFNYDLFLLNKTKIKTDNELKQSYKNENVKSYFKLNKTEAMKEYLNKSNKLEEKHNLGIKIKKESIGEKIKSRDNIKVKREKIKEKDLNKVFIERKKNGELSNQLIKLEDKIVSYEDNDNSNYMSIKDYEKLYDEDSIQTKSYSSLDRAFLLHPEMDIKKEYKTIKDLKNLRK